MDNFLLILKYEVHTQFYYYFFSNQKIVKQNSINKKMADYIQIRDIPNSIRVSEWERVPMPRINTLRGPVRMYL